MSTKEERLFILFMIFRFLQPFRCKIIPPLGKRLFIRAVYLNISISEGVHMKIYCCLLNSVNNSFFSRQAYTHLTEEMPPKPHLLTWGPAFTKQHQISNSQQEIRGALRNMLEKKKKLKRILPFTLHNKTNIVSSIIKTLFHIYQCQNLKRHSGCKIKQIMYQEQLEVNNCIVPFSVTGALRHRSRLKGLAVYPALGEMQPAGLGTQPDPHNYLWYLAASSEGLHNAPFSIVQVEPSFTPLPEAPACDCQCLSDMAIDAVRYSFCQIL